MGQRRVWALLLQVSLLIACSARAWASAGSQPPSPVEGSARLPAKRTHTSQSSHPAVTAAVHDAPLTKSDARAAFHSQLRVQLHSPPEQIHLSLGPRPDVMVVTWVTFPLPNAPLFHQKGAPSSTSAIDPERGFGGFVARVRASSVSRVGNARERARRQMMGGHGTQWTHATAHTRAYRVGDWNGFIHTAFFVTLHAGAPYEYQVSTRHSDMALRWSALHRFRTLPNTALPANAVLALRHGGTAKRLLAVAVVGDMGLSQPARWVLGAMASDRKLDGVMHLGDFGYAFRKGKWHVQDPDYAAVKQQSWDLWFRMIQPIASRLPYQALPGNHEDTPYDAGLIPYAYRFVMPSHVHIAPHATGAQAIGLLQRPSGFYYTFHLGLATVVMLNSEEPLGRDTPQHNWLVATLRQANKQRGKFPFLIVCLHRPLWSSHKSQNYKLRHSLLPVLQKFRVQLLLCGHDHSYERSHALTHIDSATSSTPTVAEREGSFAVDRGVENGHVYRDPSGCVHVRVATGGIELGRWLSAQAPKWSAHRRLQHGYARLAFYTNRSLVLNFVSVSGKHTNGAVGNASGLRVPRGRNNARHLLASESGREAGEEEEEEEVDATASTVPHATATDRSPKQGRRTQPVPRREAHRQSANVAAEIVELDMASTPVTSSVADWMRIELSTDFVRSFDHPRASAPPTVRAVAQPGIVPSAAADGRSTTGQGVTEEFTGPGAMATARVWFVLFVVVPVALVAVLACRWCLSRAAVGGNVHVMAQRLSAVTVAATGTPVKFGRPRIDKSMCSKSTS